MADQNIHPNNFHRINDANPDSELARNIKTPKKVKRQSQQWERESDAILRRILPAYARLKKYETQ